MKGAAPEVDGVRLDRWLWAARFYKTRALAVEAIDGGKVQVDGNRVKRAKVIRSGNEIRIRQGPYEQIVIVRGLSERRGPAAEAVALYEETSASKEARERMSIQLKAVHSAFVPDENVRPTKRDRRQIDKLRGRE
jgi:ribosome-associated heat shock protein Hsp15